LSIDFLVELENKVDLLIQNLSQLKQENTQLKEDIDKKNGQIADLEKVNTTLKEEVKSLKELSKEQQERLTMAVDKVQALISKIEAA
jgi:predicted nuclease with TOPRIM domain